MKFNQLKNSIDKTFEGMNLKGKVTASTITKLHNNATGTSSQLANAHHRALGRAVVESGYNISPNAHKIEVENESGKSTDIGLRKAYGCINAHMLRLPNGSHHLRTASWMVTALPWGKTPKDSATLSKAIIPVWRKVKGQSCLRNGEKVNSLLLEIVSNVKAIEGQLKFSVIQNGSIRASQDNGVKITETPINEWYEKVEKLAVSRLEKAIAKETAQKVTEAKKADKEAEKRAKDSELMGLIIEAEKGKETAEKLEQAENMLKDVEISMSELREGVLTELVLLASQGEHEKVSQLVLSTWGDEILLPQAI